MIWGSLLNYVLWYRYLCLFKFCKHLAEVDSTGHETLMVGAWCFGCCQSHRGLPVGILLLRYSVLFTVESLSLLFILFIS